MKKLLGIALAIALVAAALVGTNAVAQRQIEDTPLLSGAVASGYFNITSDGAVGTWTLDTAQVDTSVAYGIVPGTYVTFGAVLNSAADSLDNMYLQASLDGSNWTTIDSLPSGAGNLTSTYLFAEAQGNGPIVYRKIRFIVDNDGGDATSGTVLTGHVVTSAP